MLSAAAMCLSPAVAALCLAVLHNTREACMATRLNALQQCMSAEFHKTLQGKYENTSKSQMAKRSSFLA